ncbi:hypothetical protein LJR066_005821 [Acidovorax sp. LjRoot66]|uniref:hypothetical protein n=1 Tax=Acidovorax sp. LjRoot66 TaxID=3342334 RepID=UPI003ED0F561
MLKEVAALETAGFLKTHYFPFEQRNRRVKAFVPGSGATWKQSNLSWKEARGTWNDYKVSVLFEPLRKLLGAHVDAQHLDSAVKAGCSVFLTSDKTDIWSKREAILALTNIRVLHMPSELAKLRQMADAG